jgi:hypothetical protein
MVTRHAHPRALFPTLIAKANLGEYLSTLVKEKLAYLADGNDNSADIEQFQFALDDLLDTTPNAKAVLAQHRARDARERAHKRTFGQE